MNYVNDEDMTGAMRQPALAYTLAPNADRCIACHNSEHDDEFDYDLDAPLVDHTQPFIH